MSGIFLIDSLRVWIRTKAQKKRLRLAQSWPIATGEVLSWKLVPAAEEVTSLATPEQIETSFYFTLNGEYFGGHFRSVALSRSEIAAIRPGTPPVNIRYDPKNPDSTAVLEQDNQGNLPFHVLSGSQGA
ncbi:DUF3592 domain-containing protein [Granulicella sp. dw_53]|uniref:DUF3592 domain-containing protein n=1 Tax=Granulicella sp. dw_53 TaxID=2719792 RepID=UPI001BD29144|nr:DUF3592 domain-containing protein [Granulicella sp. dw_53]